MYETYEGTLDAREALHKRTGRLVVLNPELTHQSLVIPFWTDKQYQAAVYTAERYIRAAFDDKNAVTRKAFWTKMYVQRQSQMLLLEVGVV